MISLNQVEHFAPAVQLIAGVNFAYILVNISQKLSDIFAFGDKTLDSTYGKLEMDITLDITSLESLEPLTSGTNSNKPTISSLIEKFGKLKTLWAEKKLYLGNFFEKYKSYNGLPMVFLYASLYCVTDLFLMGYCGAMGIESSAYYVFVNACAVIALIYYILKPLFCKETESKDAKKACVLWYILFLFGCYIVSILIDGKTLTDYVPYIMSYSAWASVILPFIPIFIAAFYIFVLDWILIAWSKILYNWFFYCKLKKLRKEKNKIEEAYTTLTPTAELSF